jgi:hypothetical protein
MIHIETRHVDKIGYRYHELKENEIYITDDKLSYYIKISNALLACSRMKSELSCVSVQHFIDGDTIFYLASPNNQIVIRNTIEEKE